MHSESSVLELNQIIKEIWIIFNKLFNYRLKKARTEPSCFFEGRSQSTGTPEGAKFSITGAATSKYIAAGVSRQRRMPKMYY